MASRGEFEDRILECIWNYLFDHLEGNLFTNVVIGFLSVMLMCNIGLYFN
ncbi:hypothetical protein QJS10_CPB17g00210 [Acorus calamus]|uniref:Uncharacterized protein n=1 Tax=Acorus calamus TaxID=4465 RepID=A0AAV9CXX1_ACOCL|nr:hypothetical protein QJS10_CPB17g00210 [Acorus calamus]